MDLHLAVHLARVALPDLVDRLLPLRAVVAVAAQDVGHPRHEGAGAPLPPVLVVGLELSGEFRDLTETLSLGRCDGLLREGLDLLDGLDRLLLLPHAGLRLLHLDRAGVVVLQRPLRLRVARLVLQHRERRAIGRGHATDDLVLREASGVPREPRVLHHVADAAAERELWVEPEQVAEILRARSGRRAHPVADLVQRRDKGIASGERVARCVADQEHPVGAVLRQIRPVLIGGLLHHPSRPVWVRDCETHHRVEDRGLDPRGRRDQFLSASQRRLWNLRDDDIDLHVPVAGSPEFFLGEHRVLIGCVAPRGLAGRELLVGLLPLAGGTVVERPLHALADLLRQGVDAAAALHLVRLARPRLHRARGDRLRLHLPSHLRLHVRHRVAVHSAVGEAVGLHV